MGLSKKLVKLIGDGFIIFGIIFTCFGVYGILGGTGIQFHMSGRLVTPARRWPNYLISWYNTFGYRDSYYLYSL